MRKLFYSIVIVFLFCAIVEASWRMNPHTRKLDYYEAGNAEDAFPMVEDFVSYGGDVVTFGGAVVTYSGIHGYYITYPGD